MPRRRYKPGNCRSRTEPTKLSTTQWELVRQAVNLHDWDTAGMADDATSQEALSRAMRQQRNRVPTAIATVRKNNLQRLTEGRGAVSVLAALLGVAYQAVVSLRSGTDVMGTPKARQIEGALGLSAGWLDANAPEVPVAVWDRMQKPAGLSKGSSALRRTAPTIEAQPPGRPWPDLGSALHQAVLEKFVSLTQRGQVSEPVAFEMLGRLLALEQPAAPNAQRQ
jgi:hypothetical protein